MTLKMRLRLCIVMIVLTVAYTIIITTQSPQLASAIGIGYIALLATGMYILEFWRKP